MKLTFIGTSDGVPRPDRYCTCMMLEVGGSTYLIDAGAPVCDIFPRMGKSLTDIRAVFITHIHGDHAENVYRIADIVNGLYKEHEMDFYIPDEEHYRAEVRFEEKGSGWRALVLVILVSIVGAALVCFLLPDMIQLVDNMIGILSENDLYWTGG